MGLDQYAFCIDESGEKEELAYWRKHPNLQGWMERLWNEKRRNPKNIKEFVEEISNDDDVFNCVDLELNYEDLSNLEKAVINNNLPMTSGFFFGNNADNEYREEDLEFIKKAREALDAGLHVIYTSWW
jgi:hypothetical protein